MEQPLANVFSHSELVLDAIWNQSFDLDSPEYTALKSVLSVVHL